MKLFEFIYYCIYKPFVLIKRRSGAREEKLVSELYSGMLFINSIMVLLLLKFFIPYRTFNLPSTICLCVIIFIGLRQFCNNYFVKKENYIRIINFYNEKHIENKKLIYAIGIVYVIGSPILFIEAADVLSNIDWHL